MMSSCVLKCAKYVADSLNWVFSFPENRDYSISTRVIGIVSGVALTMFAIFSIPPSLIPHAVVVITGGGFLAIAAYAIVHLHQDSLK